MQFSIKVIPLMLIILLSSCSKKDPDPDPEEKETTVSDIDGNIYKTVKIGSQTWMAENLNVAHYRNGDEIIYIDDDTWDEQSSGAYCYYDNNPTNRSVYGLLYNWYTVNDSRGLCPDGWHIPTYAEWETLSATGLEHKEEGTDHWMTPNTCYSQFSGFNALPGGNCGYDGNFNALGEYGYWWTSTEESTANAWVTLITNQNAGLSGWFNMDKWAGGSIRCIKDSK